MHTDFELHLVKRIVWAIGEKFPSRTIAWDSFGKWGERRRVGHTLWRNGRRLAEQRNMG